MHRWSIFILLVLVLSSCGFLKQVKQTNERLFVKSTIAEARRQSDLEVPDSLPLPFSLYPTLQRPSPSLEHAFEIAYRNGWRDESIQSAYLSHRYDVVLHLAEETSTEYLNSLLLIGHPSEAERLLEKHSLNLPTVSSMICLAKGDTIAAVDLLKSLLKSDDKAIRLGAARHLVVLNHPEALKIVEKEKPVKDEDQSIKSYTKNIIKAAPSWLRELELVRLRHRLVQDEQWSLLADVQQALPKRQANTYPYLLLESYSNEVAIIKAYEQKDDTSIAIMAPKETQGNNFREVYGNVSNVNNWAMTYSSGLGAGRATMSGRIPTKNEYHNALKTLKDIFK